MEHEKLPANLPRELQLHDIKREFHPHSKCPVVVQSFDDYRTSESLPCRGLPTDQKPWVPFCTHLDFEKQTDTLISLIWRCAENIGGFTLKNCSDMNSQWELASQNCTKFRKFNIDVPYKTTVQSFEMHARPLWNWALDLIQDEQLAPFFSSELPPEIKAKPCPYIIYADKSKLSSFGAEKAYPVVARLANMVVDIRNSNDWGGGQIVGWLPLVKEDSAESGKQRWVNFKNAVWHAAFYKLLESIVLYSKTGIWTICGDREDRWLFPFILILASDYEEALVSLPYLLVKKDEQSDLHEKPKLQNAQESEQLIEEGHHLNSEARESLLKDRGLWNVEVSHMFNSLLHWHGLNHFDSVMNVTFNDGSKHEDISKMMLFAAHNILTDKPGHLLLECIRSYLELDMYVTLQLQTTETIAAGTEFADKNWDFPKMHSHTHIFDDIDRKGATRNFGTKIDESMHGPARAAYLRQTNFKGVAAQILRADHFQLVGKYILDQLNDLDDLLLVEDAENPEETAEVIKKIANIFVGAKQKFSDFLSEFLPAYGYSLPGGKPIKFQPQNEIIPHQFLKVFFQSLDNWADGSDYLRCNPNFHNHSRYDVAIVNTTTGSIFVQLICIFTCKVEDKVHPFAYVQPLDAGTGQLLTKDKALHFHRVCAKPRQKSEFISVHTIIQGALLAPDFDKSGGFLVIDMVDTDMFLQLKSMYPESI
ncbi:hypothetical protein B0H10DRAFT_2162561 [Mycena sp. CBHHK59/15]|nr:hypothetical protein B0H10DRAFT_2162561 [Mycena sp. CBHHK59/15]